MLSQRALSPSFDYLRPRSAGVPDAVADARRFRLRGANVLAPDLAAGATIASARIRRFSVPEEGHSCLWLKPRSGAAGRRHNTPELGGDTRFPV